MSGDNAQTLPPGSVDSIWRFLPLAALVSLMFPVGVVITALATEVWANEAASYGPLVLVACCWLIVDRLREHRYFSATPNAAWKFTFSFVAIAIPFFIIGTIIEILLFQVVSVVLLTAGYIGAYFGLASLRRCILPLLLLLFLAPLPAGIVSELTMPMKLLVSNLVEEILFFVGYPIARDGVMLHVGGYQLLVADACAGLQTLFSLEALGLLYLNIVKRRSAWRNLSMSILIVPISLCANVFRVLLLVLVTFHWGDSAGQGYLHDFAGIVLFVSALLLIIAVDTLVQRSERVWKRYSHE